MGCLLKCTNTIQRASPAPDGDNDLMMVTVYFYAELYEIIDCFV